MKIKIVLFFVILLAIACQNTSKEEAKSVKETIEVETTTKKEVAHAQKIELKIEGMTCTGCENAIQKTIDNFDGVYSSKADHVKGIATFEMDSTKVDISKVEEAINELGYDAKGHLILSE